MFAGPASTPVDSDSVVICGLGFLANEEIICAFGIVFKSVGSTEAAAVLQKS